MAGPPGYARKWGKTVTVYKHPPGWLTVLDAEAEARRYLAVHRTPAAAIAALERDSGPWAHHYMRRAAEMIRRGAVS